MLELIIAVPKVCELNKMHFMATTSSMMDITTLRIGMSKNKALVLGMVFITQAHGYSAKHLVLRGIMHAVTRNTTTNTTLLNS